ncbi:OLC1v1001984C1 [Oldenlandia corymbosa var. corymbosa]|uniref:OLC1v1001984C1 n=1 Tax=Oldenlandia corymbosa var. corymbosa TaxID=529605 RepID=A0AAV1D798_OLDCO|nr:OLC1v1001984C1 [Oldenlandia corymbosa var. corymbosa]
MASASGVGADQQPIYNDNNPNDVLMETLTEAPRNGESDIMSLDFLGNEREEQQFPSSDPSGTLEESDHPIAPNRVETSRGPGTGGQVEITFEDNNN